EPAEHHEGEEQEQRGQNEFPFAEMMFAFREPEQKQRDRRDQAGSGGNRKAGKVLSAIGAGFSFMIRGGGIESGQTQRTAGQITEDNDLTCDLKYVEKEAKN